MAKYNILFAVAAVALAFGAVEASSAATNGVAAAGAPGAPLTAPALVVTLEQNGVNAIRDFALPIINGALAGTINLPDISQTVDVPVVGHVEIDLTSIAISGFQLPELNVGFAAPDEITTTAGGLTLDVNMDFHYRKVHWPHVSDHGTVSVKASGGSLDLAMSLTSVAGKPHLNVVSSSVDMSSFDIHFSGKVSWLYNFIVGLFKGTLKKAVDSAVNKEVSTVINDNANKALEAMKFNTHLGGGKSRADLNYALASVNASSSYIAIGDMLAITNNFTGTACPIAPAVLPVQNPVDPNNFVQILLASSFLNCFGWVSFDNDAVHERVDPSVVPGLLNSSAWAGIAPGLPKKVGPNVPLAVYIDLLKAPGISSTTEGTVAAADLSLNFSAVMKTGEQHTHRLGLHVDFGLGVTVANVNDTATLEFNVTTLDLNVTAIDSEVGPIDVSQVNGFFETILPLVRDLLDAVLAKGVPLPGAPSGLGFVNPHVSQGEGYIAISTDFKL